jgi:hypothetical protein
MGANTFFKVLQQNTNFKIINLSKIDYQQKKEKRIRMKAIETRQLDQEPLLNHNITSLT